MKERDELELILKLIGKYNLPLSPILEYAIKEKMEEYGDGGEEMTTSEVKDDVQTEEHTGYSLVINDSQSEKQNTLTSRYIIRVKYPNGSTFCSKQVWETLVDVVNYAGPERVRQLNIICMGDNLVSSRLNENPQYRAAQKNIGRGLYVCTFSSTDTKYKQIERINEELRLGLRIEKVYADHAYNSNARTKDEPRKKEKINDWAIETNSEGESKKSLSKRRFVLETVKSYVRHNPTVSYETLLRIFPATLNYNRANGVIKRYNDVLKKCTTNPNTRDYFFLKDSEIIQLSNGQKVVVHSQWGDDFERFLKVAESLFNVERSGGGYILDATTILQVETTDNQPITNMDYRVGYTVRVFPSQQVGVIVNVKIDNKGIKKLIVSTNEGKITAIDDLPYLYEVLERRSLTQRSPEKKLLADKEYYSPSTDYYDIEGQNGNPPLDDLEVEHVFLDSKGNVVDTVTNTSTKLERGTATENRRGKPWTKEEEQQIEDYFRQGKRFDTIATMIGRTEVAVKSRLGMMGLIDYTYGQEEQVALSAMAEGTDNDSLEDFKVENGFVRASILNRRGETVFTTDGKLKFMGGKLYRLNLKNACFTIKSMDFDGNVWMKGAKKIVAYPQMKLFRVLDSVDDYCEAIEEIVDSPMFEECRVKVNGLWYNYKGEPEVEAAAKSQEENYATKSDRKASVMKHPLYAVRRQAVLRAIGYFRQSASIRDVARTISRTAWGTIIREEEVEEVIRTIDEVECVDGKYKLRRK